MSIYHTDDIIIIISFLNYLLRLFYYQFDDVDNYQKFIVIERLAA